jgi:hypothetical protein
MMPKTLTLPSMLCPVLKITDPITDHDDTSVLPALQSTAELTGKRSRARLSPDLVVAPIKQLIHKRLPVCRPSATLLCKRKMAPSLRPSPAISSAASSPPDSARRSNATERRIIGRSVSTTEFLEWSSLTDFCGLDISFGPVTICNVL